MLIPKFWAEHEISFPHKNKIATIKRYGWSNENQNNAKYHAVERCESAKQTLQSGTAVKRIEGKDVYLDTWGLPIREQIVQEYPDIDSVTTINNYGAICLNVADVMIFDCDNENIIWQSKQHFNLRPPKPIAPLWLIFPSLLLMVICGCLGYHYIAKWGILIGIIAGFFCFLLLVKLMAYLDKNNFQKWLTTQGGYSGLLDKFLAYFLKRHPDFAFYVYQTPNGFRLIEANHLATPDSDIAKLCFTQLPVDSNYTHLCKVQHCYRARVTGKPWRMGMAKIPFRYFWLTEDPDFIQRIQWLEQYQQKMGSFSACRFVKIVGHSQKFHSKIHTFIALHDDLCKAKTDFPLA